MVQLTLSSPAVRLSIAAAATAVVIAKCLKSRKGSREAKLIDGKAIAADVRKEVKEENDRLKKEGIHSGLAVVLVGARPDSATYVRMKTKACEEVGCFVLDKKFPDTVSEAELIKCIDELNNDKRIHGILVQLPLPSHVNESKVLTKIAFEKDVDGFSSRNIGELTLKGGKPSAVACTPAGCMELLKRSGVDVAGKNCVVLGRSNIVGMPMALLLTHANGSVKICHSKTKDIPGNCREADIIIAAIGKPQFVKGDWLKDGAVVIDVGINSIPDATKKSGQRLVGDVDFDGCVASGLCAQITPVPGGVGPMTIAMLLKNTQELAKMAAGKK
jgi:5,10-methylene-tetrahydrofolate dehydrogenase/methenyl tetrahydrofolate cyclohydrolase